ncbi:MAG: adenylate/guanylate cyclase domain-containing protein [Desulfobacterales bacterium]|nr:adenylate/guanylate cyclase domain-containing protein [Desulfobacterales bacterium]
MAKLPPPVLKYIYAQFLGDQSLAYFLTDRQGKVIERGGDLDRLNLNLPLPGDTITDALLFMEGLLPLDTPSLQIPCVKMESDLSVDVHLFPTSEGYGLILVDATRTENKRVRLQQKANELVLLREKHARIINQYLGKGLAEQLLDLNFNQSGERKKIAILFADIRGFTQYAEQRDAGQVFDMLNEYLSVMIQPVLEEGGMVDKIIGDAVMAIFGILPSGFNPAVQVLHTAFKVIENVKLLGSKCADPHRAALQVGIGIASGEVILGILGTRERRTLSVIGHSVNLASRLEKQARPGQIIIDKTTYNAAGQLREAFTPVQLKLKGIRGPINAFVRDSAW